MHLSCVKQQTSEQRDEIQTITDLYLQHISILFLNSVLDVGHLDFLEKAAELGDYLIVGLHNDAVSWCTTIEVY